MYLCEEHETFHVCKNYMTTCNRECVFDQVNQCCTFTGKQYLWENLAKEQTTVQSLISEDSALRYCLRTVNTVFKTEEKRDTVTTTKRGIKSTISIPALRTRFNTMYTPHIFRHQILEFLKSERVSAMLDPRKAPIPSSMTESTITCLYVIFKSWIHDTMKKPMKLPQAVALWEEKMKTVQLVILEDLVQECYKLNVAAALGTNRMKDPLFKKRCSYAVSIPYSNRNITKKIKPLVLEDTFVKRRIEQLCRMKGHEFLVA